VTGRLAIEEAQQTAMPAAQSLLGMAQYRASELLTRTLTNVRYNQTSGALLLGLLIAFAYGVIHTLGPGHGKAVVVSYFIGRRGGLVRGIGMGCRIAFFHVISAVAVVSLADFAFRQVSGAAPSDFGLVRQISYAGIVAVGSYLLLNAARTIRHRANSQSHIHNCPCAVHADHHDRLGGGLLSLVVGAVPCSGAISILFYGLANDLLVPSIALVAAISVGMAVAMSAIGISALYGGRFLKTRLRRRVDGPSRLVLSFEVASSALVFLLGVLLLASTVVGPTTY
jgi:ABC-type nickel/cobalt efflux system permease component RcnA